MIYERKDHHPLEKTSTRLSEMTSYQLREKLHFCSFSVGTVFLDIGADRYFLLPHNKALPLERFLNGNPSRADEQSLIDLGLIEPATTCKIEGQQSLISARSSLLDDQLPRASNKRTIEAIVRQLSYRRKLKQRSLDHILSKLRSQRDLPRQSNATVALEVAAAYQRARRYVLASERCLPISLAMSANLNHLGVESKLVFGVTMPFSAHCWVQIEDVVISDSLDRVLPFRPIMVV